MNRQQALTYIGLIGLALGTLISCVSVKLPQNESTKASGIIHSEVSPPFLRFYPEHLDAAWRNSKNGNSISYYTECTKDEATSYKNIQKGMLRSLGEAKIQREFNINIAESTGLRTILAGEVDGQVSLVDLIIFSKNRCTFILTYVGKKKSFLEDKKAFEIFYKSFEVNE